MAVVKGSSRRWLLLAAAVGATAVAYAIGVSPGAAFVPGGNPCALTSSAQDRAILGFPHDTVFRAQIGGTSEEDPSGVTISYCDEYAWRGSAPKSMKALILGLRSGTIAVYAFETWVPHTVDPARGPNHWTSAHTVNGHAEPPDFDALSSGSGATTALFAATPFGKLHLVHVLSLPKLGAEKVTGLSGNPYAGIRAAGGDWWSHSSSSIIGIVVIDSTSYNTTKQLNRFANIAVPTFGL